MTVLIILGFTAIATFAVFGFITYVKGLVPARKVQENELEQEEIDPVIQQFVSDVERAKQLAGITPTELEVLLNEKKEQKKQSVVESLEEQRRKHIAAQAFLAQPIVPEVLDTLRALEQENRLSTNTPLTDEIINEGKE